MLADRGGANYTSEYSEIVDAMLQVLADHKCSYLEAEGIQETLADRLRMARDREEIKGKRALG